MKTCEMASGPYSSVRWMTRETAALERWIVTDSRWKVNDPSRLSQTLLSSCGQGLWRIGMQSRSLSPWYYGGGEGKQDHLLIAGCGVPSP